MTSSDKSTVSGYFKPKKTNSQTDVPSDGSTKPTVQAPVVSVKQTVKRVVSSCMSDSGASASKKLKGKAVDNSDEVIPFRDVKLGPHDGEVRFRLIHFWEARKVLTKVLLGVEMLLIDAEGTVIQGFITPGRMATYLPHMVPGATYRLTNFFGSESKTSYRVAEPDVTISFSGNSVLSVLEDITVCFPEDRFRFHGSNEFEATCDLKGDLYDFIDHIRLVNGHTLNETRLDTLASTQRFMLHIQTYGGPVMKLNLWDQAATSFAQKVKAHGRCPSVILVTTFNPKRYRGAMTLSSLSSSRLFTDTDVEPTRNYLAWLSSNQEVACGVNADIVTKTEKVTIGDLLSYMKQDGSKCQAIVDDVVHGKPWYYIGCAVCHTKATKGPTTLMCKKCGDPEIVGVPLYLAKISASDNSDQASFVLFCDAGFEVTGKKASALVESYLEANELMGADDLVPVPQALIDAIGKTYKFVVKVSPLNLSGENQTLTVTKVLPPDIEEVEAVLKAGEIALVVHQMGHEDAPLIEQKDSGDGSVKSSSEMVERDEANHTSSG